MARVSFVVFVFSGITKTVTDFISVEWMSYTCAMRLAHGARISDPNSLEGSIIAMVGLFLIDICL